ncbi:MAG: hypothetical protein PHV02_03325 [Rhodocyclaceae bacterium]|nr:hypothetical protein [Rhodocyclaceae bacterium]
MRNHAVKNSLRQSGGNATITYRNGIQREKRGCRGGDDGARAIFESAWCDQQTCGIGSNIIEVHAVAILKFFLLPASECAKALELHAIAKEDALAAKRDLLAKYGADAILRSGVHIEALAWRDQPIAMAGFTVPKWNAGQGVWLQKPKKNTLRGKQAAQEMGEVGKLLEIWQWSLESALGVDGSLFGYYRGSRVFLNSIARPLNDGRVVLSLPVRDSQDYKRGSLGSDPVAPPFAVEIPQAEAEQLVGEPVG